MNEQLIVKNFGPIKDATVDFKRVTVFIGPTGGGKSTLVKLAAIFRTKVFFSAKTPKELHNILNELLYNYEINNYAQSGVFFNWKVEDKGKFDEIIADEDKIIVKKNLIPEIGNKDDYITNRLQKNIESNKLNGGTELEATEVYYFTQILSNEFEKLTLDWYKARFLKTVYIPADRLFVSVISKFLPNIRLKNSSLGKPITDFLESFSISRQRLIRFSVDFLNIISESNQFESKIISANSSLNLSESASGVQSVVPMLSIIFDKLHWNDISSIKEQFSFIVEEPELNLYPIAQQGLTNLLVKNCTNGANDLTLTTHSPYILSSCNLLLEAYKVAQLRPDLEEEIAAIVPKECWLNPDEFAAYYVADGTVKPITDDRTRLIGGNELDAVSGDISDSFRKLLRLKKQVA